MDYLEQLNRAIEHIESHLDDELIMEEISKEAGISKWHFQRIFKAVLGETVKEYATRRRLSLAALELVTSNKSILDVSLHFGFASHEVFSRAFKQLFKMPPSDFRLKHASATVQIKPKITKDYIEHLYKGTSMEAKFVMLERKIARGVSAKINEVNSSNFSENLDIIPKLWNELKKQIGDLSGQRLSLIDSDLNYFAGVVVPDEHTLSHIETREISAGEYAEFIHIGPMSKIGHTMNYIYGSWFLKSGRLRGAGPDISLHTEKTNPTSPDNEIMILIPLK